VIEEDCNGVDFDTVRELARILRRNPRYVSDPLYNQYHHRLMASIARRQGDFAATIEHIQKGIAHRPSSELNMMMVTALSGDGDFAAAHDFIDNAEKQGPGSPLRAIAWRRDLDSLRAYISELERYSPGEQSNQPDGGTEADES
jgi:hypothetical protein